MRSNPDLPSELLQEFLSARPRLFGIAYRMLGSAAEAEDLLQDVWLRWQVVNRGEVKAPAAFLTTTTVRLAINVAKSARVRREAYVGSWLPEPVDTRDDPYLGAARGEALQLAVLTMLEKLSPQERAAYVLREAFDYPYPEIASLLRLSEANVRQLVSRAGRHVSNGRRAQASAEEHRRLLDAFLAAARRGDAQQLEAMLAADVVSKADGGGIVRAARRPVVGRERVANMAAALAGHFWEGLTALPVEANGQPGILLLRNGVASGFFSVEAGPDGIEQILWMLRPSKLTGIHGGARK